MGLYTIGLVATLALTLLLVPLASDAQQATKVHRIGWLVAGSPPSGSEPRLDTFRQGIRDLGYVEGQNLLIEYRSAEGSDARLRDLAAELVHLPVEVIVAGGSAATRAAQQATRTIPIVMASSGDPVGRGFVASLARPGGNITGLSNFVAELPGKQLELLKEAVPQGTRIAVLTNPAAPSHGSEMETLAVAAKALGVHVHVVPLRSRDELAGAFAALTREGAEALVVLGEPLLLDHIIGAIMDLAAQHRLPAIYRWRSHVEAGGLMSYGPNQPAYWRRIAYYVDRILQGAKPADLPVEQPTKFELILNLKTAQALGITFPSGLLMLADEVIQ
jgi:putative tryptophan/tyrosine transport system substrate-binding protein